MADSLKQRFLYSNGTLRNKLHIHDSSVLSKLEYQITSSIALQMLQHPIQIRSLKQLVIIHKHMFGSLYSWAGLIRSYQLQKSRYKSSNLASSWFLRSNSLANACMYINKLIRKVQYEGTPSKKDYAQLLDSINYLHPFREGNGRATKVFLQLLAINHGQFIQYNRDSRTMIRALQSANINRITRLITVTKLEKD